QDQSGLAAGVYSVTVTDANGCSTSNSITLTQPSILTSSISSPTVSGGYNVSCNGSANGSIDFAPTGGDAATYVYNWSNSVNTQDQSGLAAGVFSVTVTDANGCATSNSITLTEPAILTSSISSPTVSGGYNVSCNGSTNGSIDFAPTGGDAATYVYNWSDAANTQDQSGLAAGVYSVTVTDANGCSTSNNITLTQPSILTSSISSPTVSGGYNVSCNGSTNGSIDFAPTGGDAATYVYNWSDAVNTEDQLGLAAG